MLVTRSSGTALAVQCSWAEPRECPLPTHSGHQAGVSSRIRAVGVVAATGEIQMSVFIRLAAMAALCGVLLITAPAQSQAQTQATSQADSALWGLYTRLAGTTRQEAEGYKVRWRWSQSGRELIEEYVVPRTGKVAHSATITTGSKPGTLHLKGSAMGGKEWNGRVQPDGSVVYVGTGLLKLHFKAVLASDGAYEIRSVKLRDGAVVSVAEPSSRFLPENGSATTAPAAALIAAVPTQAPSQAPPTSAPVAAPAAPATPVRTPATQSFPGWLDALIGRSLVGTSPMGGVFNLTVSREGDALVMATDNGRLSIRPGSMPGRFELLEAWHGGSINDKAIAYVAGSAGAPAGDPLDSYYADPRKPGDLVVSYDISGGYIILVFTPDSRGGLSISQDGGKRTFGMRRAVGNLDYIDVRWYQPATQQATEHALAYSAARQRQQEEERRADELYEAEMAVERQQRAAAWEQTRAASEQALADSVARLNGTVASVEGQQAQYRAQQQAAETAAANARRQSEIDNARAATQRQEDQAAQHAAQQRAAEQQRAAAVEQSRTAAVTVTNTDRAKAPTQATGEAAHKPILGFCSGLTLGGFERDNEAVIYVSNIGPVDYVFGQPMEPLKAAYAAKVGVAGLIADCMVSTDRAVLERKRQEAIDNRGYPNAKRVMTVL